MKRKQKGVTLMELLAVVAVIGILASVAIPSYRRYMLRSQRSDALTALLRLQTAQEKNYLQYGRYVTTTANLPNAPGTGASAGLGVFTTSERGFYNLTVASTATGYTATATADTSKGQKDDTDCRSFSITEGGTKSARNSSGTDTTALCYR